MVKGLTSFTNDVLRDVFALFEKVSRELEEERELQLQERRAASQRRLLALGEKDQASASRRS